MLTAQIMKSMDDHHLVASIHAAQDPLTSSAAEIELLTRFEALLDEKDDALNEAVENYGFEAKDITALGEALIQNTDNTVALLSVVLSEDLDTPEALRAELDLARKFRELVEDAGDVFTRLLNLSTTAQE